MKQTEVVSLIDFMVSKGYLELAGDKYPVLHVTNRGWDVLDGKALVKRKQEPRPEAASAFAASSGKDQELFERLRQKRRALAQKKNVPPFVIFSDRSLRDMAAKKPQTDADFLDCSGVGNAKLLNYGKTMMRVIRDYLRE